MPRPWRDIVDALAGAEAALSEYVDQNLDGMVVTEVIIPNALLRGLGLESNEAWANLAHRLGDFRLVESLKAGGWTVVEEVIDEATYVVARDPGGMVWAIGVASADGGRRRYLEWDMDHDDRAARVAFIEPIDTRSPDALSAALEPKGRRSFDDRT